MFYRFLNTFLIQAIFGIVFSNQTVDTGQNLCSSLFYFWISSHPLYGKLVKNQEIKVDIDMIPKREQQHNI